MKHGAKRLISLLTVLVMVCSHTAVSVSAADADTVTVLDNVEYGGETGDLDISGMGDSDDSRPCKQGGKGNPYSCPLKPC